VNAVPEDAAGRPAGDVYDWYVRGQELLAGGNPAAAAQLLRHAVEAEPGSRAAREALARALFDAREYDEARAMFATIIAESPSDDYAHFGLGLAALRSGDHRVAVEHLSLAAAMKPAEHHYATALRAARVRLEAQDGAGDDEDAGDTRGAP
jgi:Flp pilus assembly protein TadD